MWMLGGFVPPSVHPALFFVMRSILYRKYRADSAQNARYFLVSFWKGIERRELVSLLEAREKLFLKGLQHLNASRDIPY
jgi:hypothetical protein